MACALVLCALFGEPLRAENAIPTPLGPAGVIVEEVERFSLGEKAGLKPGDVLVDWVRAPSYPMNPLPAGGTIFSPFDVQEILIEQAPRGALTLHGLREGKERSWTLIAGASIDRVAIQVRPFLSVEVLAFYEEGKTRFAAAAEPMEAASYWLQGLERAYEAGESSAGLWLHARLAEELLKRRVSDSETLANRVAPLLAASGRAIAAAEMYGRLASRKAEDRDWEAAKAFWGKAERSANTPARDSLEFARVQLALGAALRLKGEVALARVSLRQALGIRASDEFPGSLDLAESLHELGRAEHVAGDLKAALALLKNAEALQRFLEPSSRLHARFVDSLGIVYFNLGDPSTSLQLGKEALRYLSIVEPTGYDIGRVLLSLGHSSSALSDLAKSEEYLRASLAIWDNLPASFASQYNRANVLVHLGDTLAESGNLVDAEAFGRLAVGVQTVLGPTSRGWLHAQEVLARTLTTTGKIEEARTILRQTLAVYDSSGSSSYFRMGSLRFLGQAELMDRHRPEAAEAALSEAQQILEASGSKGYFWANTLKDRGEANALMGRHSKAESLLEEALSTLREIAPGGVDEASALRLLGLQKRALGRKREASSDLCQAAATLDRLRDRVGQTTEGSSRFMASRSFFYTDCIESLLELGHKMEAFQVLESGRARGLLDLMAQRDLSLEDLPADLRDERKRLRYRYEEVYSSLSSAKLGEDPKKNLELRQQLDALSGKLEALSNSIRSESPRFASIHDPVPLGLPEARSTLDTGTLLLAYSVGEEKSFLFAVRAASDSGQSLQVFPIAIPADRLRSEVQVLTTLLANRRASPVALKAKSRALYRLLISPAASAIAGAERLLIAPDGPLHSLPFGALVRPNGRHLIEAKPIHTIVSATVYAELKKERKPDSAPREMRLAAFGDPKYPGLSTQKPEEAEDLLVRSALRRGLPLTPLPGTRREVQALGELYPNSEIYVGAEATEERAKALGKEPRIIHFAGHALLDKRMPLNSSLALTIPERPLPGQENGLLQAWEIFEQLRIDADLVTLSACNTALGKEMGGEGLVGLTRAFQFAGARSVLASLWAIGDGATSRFMPRFYEHLRDGMTKDEALRQTQIEWIRNPRTSHPFNWAAFQLIGDYR